MLVVYTTVFGNTDRLHEPLHADKAHYVCFTDQPRLRARRWALVRLPLMEQPTRAARTLKAMSHEVFPEADATLWQDANFSIRIHPDRILARFKGEITTFRHHFQSRIKDETEAIIQLGKAKEAPTRAQLAAYQAQGFDCDENPMRELSVGGFILRRHTDDIKALNRLWCAEIHTYTLRDQMSLDYIAWKLGLKIDRFPGRYNANGLTRYVPYKRPASD
jgi:hypothetical protein